MRPSHTLLLVGLFLASVPGCRGRWLFGPFQRGSTRPAEALTMTTIDPGELEIVEDRQLRTVRYRLRPPAGSAGARNLRLVELRFREPLEGARVDVSGVGPRQTLTLLKGKRIGGARLTVPVGALDLDRLDVVVHHHLRPLPLVEEVRLGRLAAPTQPAGRPRP